MKKVLSILMVLALICSLASVTACADIQIGQGSIAGEQSSGSQTNSGELAKPVQAIDVYEDENCLIQFSRVDLSSSRPTMKFRVQNKTNRQLTFQSNCMAINGETINNVSGSDDIARNSTGGINFTLRISKNEYFDFNNIKTISGTITIIDFNDKNFHDGRNSYEITFSDVLVSEDAEPKMEGEPGQAFYSDDNVDIAFLSVEQDNDKVNIWFRVKNKTNDVLTFQADTMSINGESSSRASGSESVVQQCMGNICITCTFDLDYVDLNNVTSLSGSLTVIDFGNRNFYNGRQSYQVMF